MKILGVRIDNLTINQVLERIEGFLADDQQHYIITLNPEFLVKAQKDQLFKQILNQADLAIPDGIGLIFAAWFLGQPLKQRAVGVDLMKQICQKAAQDKYTVCLIGGQPGVAQKAAENLKIQYKGLKIFAIDQRFQRPCLDEYILPLSERKNVALKARPLLGCTILFVALGMVKQEKWIAQNLKKMPDVKLAIGIGGAFDFISGGIKRAPKFMRVLGMEWFWRLLVQPWRIKRIFRAIIIFPWLVLKSKFLSTD